jgi:lipopolysaccharide/colanic/teichoic acid biosynthesis glycosyltransferase
MAVAKMGSVNVQGSADSTWVAPPTHFRDRRLRYKGQQNRLEGILDQGSVNKVYLFFKRLVDVLLSGIALIVIFPFLAVIAVLIKLDSKGPVFFHHKRIGMNNTPLVLHKFRTMRQDADEMFLQFTPEQKEEFNTNYKLENDPRITRIGKLLRESSLDELPQLINILRGNLSLVGPRPLVAEEIEKYGENRKRFLSAKPGLTGYWQVNGRNELTYQERMRLELHYVDNASFWLDMRILFKTVPVVLTKFGAR